MAPTATSRRPPVKPPKIRYFKGKAPDAAPSDDSDDSENDTPTLPEPIKIDENLVAGGAGRIVQPGMLRKMNKKSLVEVKMDLGDVKVGRVDVKPGVESSEEEETDEEEEDEEEMNPARVIKPPGSDDGSSEYETDSEEEEEVKKPTFRPVFVRKDKRGMIQEKIAAEAEAKIQAEEEMQVQRKLDSKELAGETIRRELAEKEAGDVNPDIDDTDGLDPAAEFDAWRARELARLLRDKQAQAERDLEQEEIERRRALPEEQRLREDMEFAQSTRDREKGEMGFMQKYYHKGAFHQDDDLLRRDYTGATESQVDISMLPKVMQVRDFGKMSRSKYTHLTDQDTTQGGWGTAARQAAGPGGIGTTQTGCWNCGGPHNRKDCPKNNVNDPNAMFPPGGQGGSGQGGMGQGSMGMGTSANTAQLGFGGGSNQRGWGGPPAVEGQRDGNRYKAEGKERRFDEERRNGNDRPRDRDAGHGPSREENAGENGGRHRERGNERDDRRGNEREDRRGSERDDWRERDRGGRSERRRDDGESREKRRRDDRRSRSRSRSRDKESSKRRDTDRRGDEKRHRDDRR